MKKNNLRLIALTMIIAALTACNSKTEEVEQLMKEIREQTPIKVPTPPSFESMPNYSYVSNHHRSPFIPTSLAHELKVMAGKQVFPDLQRPLQPLESYALEELYMKGTIRSKSGKIIALISTPDRHVEQLQVGHYMGKNYGRVVNITANEIHLLEVLPDGRDGYIERPRTMILHGDNQ